MVIFYDAEYSGLDTAKGHGILSIAAIDSNNPKNIFHKECRLNSNQTFDAESLNINGLSEEEIYSSSRSSLEDSLTEFKQWIQKLNGNIKPCLLSQNNPKDLEHLANGFNILNLETPFYHRNLDLHSIAYTIHIVKEFELPFSLTEESILNSDYLSTFTGLPCEEKPHSTALAGVKQTAEIFNRLVYGMNLLREFKTCQIPDYLR